jgi:hypothetical protein
VRVTVLPVAELLGVLMKVRTIAAALGALALVATLGALTPADAGRPDLVLEIDKVVNGPVPEGTVFEIEVTCQPMDGDDASEADAFGPAELLPQPTVTVFEFDANGDPLNGNTVPIGGPQTCEADEIADGGADEIVYACDVVARDMTNGVDPVNEGDANADLPDPTVTCLSDREIEILSPFEEASLTVTNTFEPEPEPEPESESAGVVVATPTFTG